MAKSLLLTTDCGAEVDDQWALAHQALAPELDLRAVVTTHTGAHELPGDSASEFTARCARDVLANLPLDGSAPDVVAGSPIPLASRADPRPGPGAERIVDEAAAFGPESRLAVLAIGAVTDVASALLLEPSLADRIDVVAMGFNGWPDGGDPFNVRNDVAAWQAMLDSGVPITIGSADVCKRHLVITPEQARVRFARGAGPYIEGLLTEWVGRHAKLCNIVTGDPASWPIWDEITTAYLLAMTEFETYPRPDLLDDTSFQGEMAGPPIRWITSLDQDTLWDHFSDLLAG